MLVNWNNKPARGFGAADDQWDYGSIHRVDLLNDNLDQGEAAHARDAHAAR